MLAKAEHDDTRDALVALEEKLSALRSRRQEVSHAAGRIEGQVAYLERAIADAKRRQSHAAQAPVPFDEVAHIVGIVERNAESASGISDIAGLRQVIEGMVRTLRSFLNDATRADRTEPEAARMQSEHAELLQRKAENDESLRAIETDETVLRSEYDALKASIEAEATESRAAEREVFRIMGRQRELVEGIARLDRECEFLARDHEEFNREIQETIVLIGRDAAQYQQVTSAADGTPLTEEVVLNEPRDAQQDRRRALEKMKIRLEELGGGGHDEIMKEYNDVRDRDAFLVREIADLEQSVEKLEALIADLTAELNEQFDSGIEKITTEFNRFFMLMFGGGSASLVRIAPKPRKKKSELEGIFDEDADAVEPELPEEEGIDIDVKLPNKRVRGLEMLSGGERALTSIALIFAMSQVNPPLFVILDETDAALDEANSRRYGDMIESLAKKSQLILITHNRETMSRAGVLYGVTMGSDGVSKLLSVKFDEAVAVAK